ncbi:MAG TPA: S1C family serine protease [Burkholderiales bacterium]|nr:S1C family serine protease [Burkholderiales bacterium]
MHQVMPVRQSPRWKPAVPPGSTGAWIGVGWALVDFAHIMRFAFLVPLCLLAALVHAPVAAQGQPAPAPPAAGSEPQLTVESLSVVKVRSKAVSNARSLRTLGPQREGSGVVIDSEGLVLTIGYLIIESEAVDLVTSDGRSYPATVVGYDNATGFGLLRALRPLPVPPVQMGQSATVADRELVLIVGYDGVAPAYVVSRRQFVGYWEYLLDEAIYTAPATVNWSGAALLNREGRLLGIGSLVVSDAMGAASQVPGNLFVPIDLLKPLLGDLLANGRSSARPRPWIGVNTQEVQGNVIVTRVSSESPAEAAAIRVGDVIVGVAGQPLTGQADFYNKLWSRGEAGVEILLDVLREGRVQKVRVKSVDRDSYFRPKPTL